MTLMKLDPGACPGPRIKSGAGSDPGFAGVTACLNFAIKKIKNQTGRQAFYRTRKNTMDDKYKAVSSVLIRPEDGRRYRSGPQERNAAKPREKDLFKEFEKEGERLGLFFNGMQERINDQHPVALFTDKKTKSTFGVEPGKSVKSKLSETRERFRLKPILATINLSFK